MRSCCSAVCQHHGHGGERSISLNLFITISREQSYLHYAEYNTVRALQSAMRDDVTVCHRFNSNRPKADAGGGAVCRPHCSVRPTKSCSRHDYPVHHRKVFPGIKKRDKVIRKDREKSERAKERTESEERRYRRKAERKGELQGRSNMKGRNTIRKQELMARQGSNNKCFDFSFGSYFTE